MTSWAHPTLVLHVLSCFFMTGAIWIIQIIHYPTFNYVGAEKFKQFHHFHSAQITWIVVPMMGCELVTGLLLSYWVGGIWRVQSLLVAAIWAATFFLSVPLHNKLGAGQDNLHIKKLIWTNWVRTLLWTVRTVLILSTVSIQLVS